MQAILIPVKGLNQSKLRLSQVVAEDERQKLGLAMLGDVLRATRGPVLRLVVTSDPDAAALAEEFGCTVVRDPGTGLNDAIAAGTFVATGLGVVALVVIPADVPLIEGSDVRMILESEADVALVRSADGGTNALMRRPPTAIPALFGARSASRHEAAAKTAGLGVAVIEAASLLLDIDLPEDLRKLASSRSVGASALLARELL